jgi:DedD protein
MADQDTEITLGAGKILGLFFGLVILCGLFFGAGYTVGKSAAPAQAASTETPAGIVANGGAKPSPAGLGQTKPQGCATPDCSQSTNSSELTFYKAVEQKDPKAQLTPAEPAAQLPVSAAAEQKTTAPEVARNSASQPGTSSSAGYIVQVAAVSKQQDADALVSALRRKQYPVNVVTVPTDKLFHVQAGPFPNAIEAEAIRTRLIGDGYNPILKR